MRDMSMIALPWESLNRMEREEDRGKRSETGEGTIGNGKGKKETVRNSRKQQKIVRNDKKHKGDGDG